ncbi:MAG: hypothetical protein K6T34_10805 [Thermoflavifilum sp.]|nr:hypothetical protein [Thermoflavifilum sp.]
METFGFHKGSFTTNREQCYPTQEYQSCLVRFGDEVTTRLLEEIHAAFVALCISEDKIPPLELEPADFSVAGVLACGVPELRRQKACRSGAFAARGLHHVHVWLPSQGILFRPC